MHPVVAYDPAAQRGLVVWLSARNAGSSSSALDVFGVFLGADGRPVGSEFAISDSTSAARAAPPAVAVGNGEFAVAWTVRGSPCQVYVQRVTNSTAVTDQRLVASSSHVHSPRLAYNAARGKYVVAYVDGDDYLSPTFLGAATSDCGSNASSTSRVRAAEFSFAGDVPSVSSPVDVASVAAGDFRPSVAFSPGLNRYLVAWEDRRSAAGQAYRLDVYARLLNSDLSPAGGELALATGGTYDSVDSSATWTPRPAVAAGTANFMVGWFNRATQNGAVVWSVLGRTVSSATSLGSMFTAAQMPFTQSHASHQPTGFLGLGFAASANEFLVAITTHLESVLGYRSFVLVQRVTASGQLLDADGLPQSDVGVGTSIDYDTEEQITVGLAPAGTGIGYADYLVAYAKHAASSAGLDYDIWANRVTVQTGGTITPTLTLTPSTPTITPTLTLTPSTPTITPTLTLTPSTPTITPTLTLTPSTPTITPTLTLTPTPTPTVGGAIAGYYVAVEDGGIYSFGQAPFRGSVPGLPPPYNRTQALRMAVTQTGNGYYVLSRDGGIFTFGDARFFGSIPGLPSPYNTARPFSIALTRSGLGYYILGDDGGVFTFGDAVFYGSVPGLPAPFNRTQGLSLIVTASGRGYYILGADGGIFTFGDAVFYGSVPGLPAPYNRTQGLGLALSPTGAGYYVVGADGGVFTFGDAQFYGSIPGLPSPYNRARPVVFAPTPSGRGYYLLTADGGIFTFGDAVYFGSPASLPPPFNTTRPLDLAIVGSSR